MSLRCSFLTVAALCLGLATGAAAFYRPAGHCPVPPGAVAVSAPGCYARAGTTYMLDRDVSSPASGFILGADVVLDLNGYTLSFADCDYGHVPDYGFEEGGQGWDFSQAPGAKVVNTEDVHIFIGKKILSLAAGDEIVSGWVELPLAGRSYLAMCGVAKLDMRVSLYVEDSSGATVRVETVYGDSKRVSCPTEDRGPRLGGGFVTAHLQGLPAGRYRVRVKALTDCLVDQIDIRPAMDVGVAVLDHTRPWAFNDQLYEGNPVAFFDLTKPGTSEPLDSLPRALGGTVTIRNGVIRSATCGILSWGVQSTATGARVILDNVRVINQGINANAVDVPQGSLTDCRFDIDTPFIINRHVSEHAVVLRGKDPSEVSGCEFYGGQGCLNFLGPHSSIHHNLFVNRQTVTNHYCVMARGDSSQVFANRFEPEIGSGLEVFRHKFIDIFDNDFIIQAAPPTCEYGHEEYSTTAIRIADYNARPGEEAGCWGNRVYNNRMTITGRAYLSYEGYIPMAWAVFYSASGGPNYFFGNEITVTQLDPQAGPRVEAAAFYVGGGTIGGEFYRNRITGNVPPVWVATPYGGAKQVLFRENTLIRAAGAPVDWKPVRMGWTPREDCIATGIEFRSNTIQGAPFGVQATAQAHSYTVGWALQVRVEGADGAALPEREVTVADRSGKVVFTGRTGSRGELQVELPEYSFSDGKRNENSPYTVTCAGVKRKVELQADTALTLTLKR